MNIKKFIVSAAAAIMLSAVPLLTSISASAETIKISESVVCEIGNEMLTSSDGVYGYYVDSKLNIAVIGQYSGSDSVVNIPAEIDGYPVIGILNGAFYQNTSITRAVIPEGIEFVGASYQSNINGAFEGCTNLSYITFPDSLWHIGYCAFKGTGLRSVTLPDSVFQIAGEAFADCTALTAVRLPEGIYDISDRCFKGCTSLRSINIPSTVVNIWGEAFADCTSLSSVVFPESLTMGDLGSYLSNSNYSSHSTSSPNGHYYCCQFKGCTSLRSVTLPDSMEIIPGGMFANSGLTNITIGSSTTYLASDAFEGCTFTNLYLPDNIDHIVANNNQFNYNNLDCMVTNKFSYKHNYGNPFYLSCYSEIEARGLWLEKRVDSGETDRNQNKIYNYYVYVEDGKEEIDIDDYVSFFSDNHKLYLPDTVTRIRTSGYGVSDYSLTNEITLGGGVMDIEDGALDVPKNLVAIHVSKAGRYSSYDGILYSDGGTTLVKFPSYYKQNDYTEIKIPYGTTTIANGAFFAANNFDKTTQKAYKLYIPETVTSIGENNFVYSTPAEIYGKPGSAAESFANEHNITFVSTDNTSDTEKYDYTETVIHKQTITRDNTNFTEPTFAGEYGEVVGTLVYTDSYGSVMTYEGVRAMLANYRSGTYTIGYRFTPDSHTAYGGEKTGTITLDMTKIPVSAPMVTITAESSRMLLSWAAVDEAIAYEINLVNGDSIEKVGDTTQTCYAYSDVTENESYSFLVRAYDGDTFSDYTDEDIVTAIIKSDDADPLAEVSVVAHNLILADNIGVNFYMSLPEDILSDTETYMKFTLPNGFVSRVFISEAKPELIDGKTCYKFPCYVAAAEMTDTITARLYYRGECSKEFTYSVTEYAQVILDNPEQYADSVPVVKAMLNYGSRSQVYFRHNTEALANEFLPAEERAVSNTEDIDLSAYKPAVTDNDSDLSFKGIVISLKSRIGMKLYFESESELALRDFTVTDGTNAILESRLATGTDENGFFLEVSNITAKDFDKSFTVSCGDLTVGNISVFSYIRQALSNSDSKLVEAAGSIYDYNRAVEAYIAAQQSSQTE